MKRRASDPDLPEVTPRQIAVILTPLPVDPAYIEGIRRQSDDAMWLAQQFVPIRADYTFAPSIKKQ